MRRLYVQLFVSAMALNIVWGTLTDFVVKVRTVVWGT